MLAIICSLPSFSYAHEEGRVHGWRGWAGTPASSGILILFGLAFIVLGLFQVRGDKKEARGNELYVKVVGLVIILLGSMAVLTGLQFLWRGAPL